MDSRARSLKHFFWAALGWLSLLNPQQQFASALRVRPNFTVSEQAHLRFVFMAQTLEDAVRIPDTPYEAKNTWLPIYNRRTPYNEDEIVDLVTEIVRVFAQLSYAEDHDIHWPPAGGHMLNESLCDELNISESARSLIRRLPSISGGEINLFQSSRLFDIAQDYGLRFSRMPYVVEGQGLILPHEVQLSCGDRESSAVFLDIQENTVRVVALYGSPETENPPDTPLERPDIPDHYRNFWPRHAPTWLRIQLNMMKTLEAIPPGIGVLGERNIDCEHEWLRRKMKLILEGTYGWPDDFQQEAYDRDRERVWEEAVREWDELGNPNVLSFP